MPVWIRNYIKFLVAACLIVSFCLAEGDAQTRRKKRRRSVPAAPKPVITNPTIAPPDATRSSGEAGDVKIISTADSKESGEQLQGSKPKVTPPEPTPEEKTQQTITDLSKQVDRLNNKLTQMQEDDRYQLDMERLTRAEQRAEQLRSQLMDIQVKIADFESKLEQIEWAIKPENIEASTAGYGSTRPEAAREARRKSLESERTRVQAQLKLAETSKSRLELAVSNADSEVDLLRQKLEQRRAQMDAQPVETPAPKPPRKPQN